MQALSDVEWIFLVLAVLYLMESSVWVRPGTVTFWVRGKRLSNPLHRRRLIGNDRGEIVLPGLLPIDGTFLPETPPLSVGAGGILAFVAAAPLQADRPNHSGNAFSWEELESLQCRERGLYARDKLVCVLRSKQNAQAMFETLRLLAALPGDERTAAIDAWRRSLVDVEATKERFEQWRSATRVLRSSALVLFLLIFPLGVAQYYELVPWSITQQAALIYLGGILLVWWWTAFQAFFAHRRLFPERRGARAKQLFTGVISPVVPLRAADHLARELFTFLHPLTLSVALHPQDQLKTLASYTLRDLRFPRLPDVPPALDPQVQRIAQEDRQAMGAMLEGMLQAEGIAVESLSAAPEPDDSSAKSYCPRCWEEYVEPNARCSNCGDRPTVAYRAALFHIQPHVPTT